MGVWAFYNCADCKVNMVGITYNQLLPKLDYKDAIVYIVDMFPNNVQELYPILESCAELHIYDHHVGSVAKAIGILKAWAVQEGWSDKLDIIYDTTRSGARITWETLCKSSGDATSCIPSVVYDVDDYDRYQFNIPTSQAVVAALVLYPHEPEVWSREVLEGNYTKIIQRGNDILEYQYTLIDEIVATARFIQLDGYKVPIVNCPYSLVDKVADRLMPHNPFVVLYCDLTLQRKFSLRSRKDGLSVVEVAQKRGGGGHEHAAGFYGELNKSVIESLF
jgi:oligoribonuclease NrnB/cAMP/cGMP phosphodiesterase (DHH superfamily)